MAETSEISPFQRLVCSAAGKAHARATQVMALDNACAQIARQAREPIMAQIRLAWWRDGLTAETLKPEHNSPEMIALRGCDRFDEARAGLIALIDGWEELILSDEGASRAMLEAYAKGRGRTVRGDGAGTCSGSNSGRRGLGALGSGGSSERQCPCCRGIGTRE